MKSMLLIITFQALRQISLCQHAPFHEIVVTAVGEEAGGALPPPLIGGGAHVES